MSRVAQQVRQSRGEVIKGKNVITGSPADDLRSADDTVIVFEV